MAMTQPIEGAAAQAASTPKPPAATTATPGPPPPPAPPAHVPLAQRVAALEAALDALENLLSSELGIR
jgi:hypothetical protein